MSDITLNQVVTTHLLIQGRVQGVGYRYSAQREATKLGLVGWIRNRQDGSVEAVAHGRGEAVIRFIEWCNEGPPGAKVTRVEAGPIEAPNNQIFDILPTA